MLAHHELAYIGDCIIRNTSEESERELANLLSKVSHLLCYSQTSDERQELSRFLQLTLSHRVVRNVLDNTPGIAWDGTSSIAIAYLAWTAQLFHLAWDNSFSHLARSLSELSGPDNSLLRLREQLQQWQRSSPLQIVSDGWEPSRHFLLDLAAVFSIWSMTRIGNVESSLYSKTSRLLQYEFPFIVVYMACACLAHNNLPCLSGAIDTMAWSQHDRCCSLLQRFAENVIDND